MPLEEKVPLKQQPTRDSHPLPIENLLKALEYISVIEHINEGFCALDSNFIVTYLNKQGEVFLNRRREEVLNKNLWECFPEAIGTDFYKQYNKALTQQVSLVFESYFKPLDIWFEVNVYPSNDGLFVLFRNMNEREKAKGELRKLSIILQETNNIVIITDSKGYITWVNKAFSRTTGYSLEEAIGQIPGLLLEGPETDPETSLFIDSCLKRGEGFHVEILYYTKSGQKYWSEIHCEVVKDAEGRIQNFYSISSDITGRIELQQRYDKEVRMRQQIITSAVIKAQEKERTMVSQELHDNVNQILTSAKLYLDLCLSDHANSIEFMSKSMNLIQKSIDEIRSLSRSLADPSLVHHRLNTSISELIEMVIKTGKFKISLDTKGIEEVPVNKDTHLAIYRILQEHLTNILKYSEAESVQVTLNVLDNDLILKVTDDGIGFDTKKKRSGIGITNMTTRAESLGGSLTINSAPGLGCVLIAKFPALYWNQD